MSWCERCQQEFDGKHCPVCGNLMLQEIHPEELPAAEPVWHIGPEKTGGVPWPTDEAGEPEEPVLLTEMSDAGMDCQLLLSRLQFYTIPSVTRYPGAGGLGKIILGFSGYGVQVFVPASRLEEASWLLDMF